MITIHPAIIECRRLKAGGTVTNHGRSLMQNVARIVARTAETRATASRLWGEGCGAYRAACDLARRQEASDLSAALERYREYTNAQRMSPCLFTMSL